METVTLIFSLLKICVNQVKIVYETDCKYIRETYASTYKYLFYSNFSGLFFFISDWFWNVIMSDLGLFHCHFLTFSFYFSPKYDLSRQKFSNSADSEGEIDKSLKVSEIKLALI